MNDLVGQYFDVNWQYQDRENGISKMGSNWLNVKVVKVKTFVDGETMAFIEGYPMCPVNVKRLEPPNSLGLV